MTGCKIRHFILNLIAGMVIALTMPLSLYADETTDETTDSLTPLRGKNWVDQLINSGFHINDPRIEYPRFPRFALKVYNWGDRTFNHYDSTYVVATGKNWKAQVKSDMWMRTYILQLADQQRSTMHITSRLYNDLGINLSFMAVSIGYTFNLNSFAGDDTKRHRFNFNFTCSRFALNYWSQTINGGAIIRKFGEYKDGHHLNYKYNDIDVDDSHFDIYYFFNHSHYSQAAAYCFSKYQLRSAGSWILGFNYDRHNMYLDFSHLPQEMTSAVPGIEPEYHFRYSDYCLLGGYAYNKVFVPRRWLLNITILPSVGYKHSKSIDAPARDQREDLDIRDILSTNVYTQASLVYNHRALFAALEGRFNGYLNFSRDYTFFYSTQSVTLAVGMRF